MAHSTESLKQMGEDNIETEESDGIQDNSSLSQASFSTLSPELYESIAFEFIVGERVNSKILYAEKENQMYSTNSTCNLGKSFLCTYTINKKRVCHARVYLVDDGRCIKLKNSRPHMHSDNRAQYKRELFCLNEMKRRCGELESFLSTTKLTVKNIFDQVLLE